MTDRTSTEIRAAGDGADRLAASLTDLSSLSRAFGSALTSAFAGAVVQGRELDSVLRSVATQLSNAALSRALAPVSNGISSGLETLVSAGAGGTAPLAGGSAPSQVRVTMNVTTPDADSFRRSESQIQTRLARAVGRGRRGL